MAHRIGRTPQLAQPTGNSPEDIRAMGRMFFTDSIDLRARLINVLPKDGAEAMENPLPLWVVATASLPSAADWEGGLVFDTTVNELKFSDGAAWITIGSTPVTNAELEDMAQSRIKGRAEGAGTGDPQDLTPAQVRTVAELSDIDIVLFAEMFIGPLDGATGSNFSTFRGTTGTEFGMERYANSASDADYFFRKSRGTTVGADGVVADGDSLGTLHWMGDDGNSFSAAARITGEVDGTPGDGDMPGRLRFLTTPDGTATPVERMRIASGGNIYATGAGTTASAANAFLDSGSTPANELLRSTSVRAAKKEIAPLSDATKALLLQPVSYKSALPTDDPSVVHIGLIAEDVAAIDPRLVQYGYQPSDYETSIVELPKIKRVRRLTEDGKVEVVEVADNRKELVNTLKKDAVKTPVNVAYDRLSVLLLGVIQQQEARITALEEKLGG